MTFLSSIFLLSVEFYWKQGSNTKTDLNNQPASVWKKLMWSTGEVVLNICSVFCKLTNYTVQNCLQTVQLRSVQSLSHVWLCDPMKLQHARPPCPSTARLHPNSCPSTRWCHLAISSSIIPFSSCPQSLPASESFPISQLFAWGGQSIGVSALESVLPKNTKDGSPLEWIGWISLQSEGLSRVFSNTAVQKPQFFGAQHSSQSNFHIHTWPLEKP